MPAVQAATHETIELVGQGRGVHLRPLWQAHFLLQASLVDLLALSKVAFIEVLVDVRVIVRVPLNQVHTVEDTIESIAPGGEHTLHAPPPFRGLDLPGIPRADCDHPVSTADASLSKPVNP